MMGFGEMLGREGWWAAARLLLICVSSFKRGSGGSMDSKEPPFWGLTRIPEALVSLF